MRLSAVNQFEGISKLGIRWLSKESPVLHRPALTLFKILSIQLFYCNSVDIYFFGIQNKTMEFLQLQQNYLMAHLLIRNPCSSLHNAHIYRKYLDLIEQIKPWTRCWRWDLTGNKEFSLNLSRGCCSLVLVSHFLRVKAHDAESNKTHLKKLDLSIKERWRHPLF